MTELSPAARAVRLAAINAEPGQTISAALRAATEQVMPDLQEPDWGACDYMHCDIELYTDHQRKRSALLAIATELENIQ